ncbi:MAG TPA: PGPGW domain-containing protein [Candidatus Angelobacter sp.]
MLKRLALIATGWALMLVGTAGLFLPVLPGVLLLIVGLSILSVEYAWARRWMSVLQRRFPSANRKLAEILRRHEKPSSA